MNIDELLVRLRKIFGKVLVEDQGSNSLFTIYVEDQPRYILCVSRESDEFFYGKVVDYDKISGFSCIDIYYSPYGLYIFARNVNEFIEKFLEKIKVIKRS